MIGFSIYPETGQDEVLMMEWAYLLDNFKYPYWVRGETELRLAQKTELPDLPIVMVLPFIGRVGVVTGTESLVDFIHPEECIYWFGGTHELVQHEQKNTIAKVYIPMPEQVIPTTAGSIIVWDRYIKNG